MEVEGITGLRIAERLRQIGIFSETTVDQLFQMAGLAREVDFDGGATIFREGEPAESFYVVANGEVELASAHGMRKVLGPGGSFGVYSVVTREPRCVSARALRDTVTIAIDAEDFDSALSENSEMLAGILRHFARRCMKPCD